MLAGCGVVRRYRIKGEDRNTAAEAAYDPKGHGTKVQYRITADYCLLGVHLAKPSAN
jgi:hypothetical protein